jgi:hypothetical protein
VFDVPVIIIRHGHVGVLNTHECLVIFCLAKINEIYSPILLSKDFGRSIDLQDIACILGSKVEASCILLQTLNFPSSKGS